MMRDIPQIHEVTTLLHSLVREARSAAGPGPSTTSPYGGRDLVLVVRQHDVLARRRVQGQEQLQHYLRDGRAGRRTGRAAAPSGSARSARARGGRRRRRPACPGAATRSAASPRAAVRWPAGARPAARGRGCAGRRARRGRTEHHVDQVVLGVQRGGAGPGRGRGPPPAARRYDAARPATGRGGPGSPRACRPGPAAGAAGRALHVRDQQQREPRRPRAGQLVPQRSVPDPSSDSTLPHLCGGSGTAVRCAARVIRPPALAASTSAPRRRGFGPAGRGSARGPAQGGQPRRYAPRWPRTASSM